MMDNKTLDREKIVESFTHFRLQLKNIFENNSISQDDTLINGFIQFVHSRLNLWICTSLKEQENIFVATHHIELENKSESVCDKHNQISEQNDVIDDKLCTILIDLLWKDIHYPIFKWFQIWKQHLVPKEQDHKPHYVEFRKMNSKLTKIFKLIHRFYYTIIENLFHNYDFNQVLSSNIMKDLNIVTDAFPSKRLILPVDGKFTILCVMLLQRCLLYLGCCHKYKITSEKLSNNFQIINFTKSMRYFDLASIIVPSVGETHIQKGMIYIQTENFGYAAYEFLRGSLSRIPSETGFQNLENILCDDKSSLFIKFKKILKNLKNEKAYGNRIINKEIIEFYFLANFAYFFSSNICDNDELEISRLREVFFEKTSTRYIKNISLVLQNLIVLIGGFDLLLKKSNIDKTKLKKVQNISSQQLKYLNFVFKYIVLLFEKIIMKEWKNFETWEYLAIVRVVECWLKSSRIVLQFAHRHSNFCKVYSKLLNDIIKSEYKECILSSEHRPKRIYFFQEDIMLKEFSSMKYSLTDFNDEDLYCMDNIPDRLAGLVNGTLTSKDEGILRLQAISVAGRKFLKNSCVSIKWDDETESYIIAKPIKKYGKDLDFIDDQSRNCNETSNLGQKVDINRKSFQSLSNLRSTVDKYSGSSVPAAPASFEITPSPSLTGKLVSNPNEVMRERILEKAPSPHILKMPIVLTSNMRADGGFVPSLVPASSNTISHTQNMRVSTSSAISQHGSHVTPHRKYEFTKVPQINLAHMNSNSLNPESMYFQYPQYQSIYPAFTNNSQEKLLTKSNTPFQQNSSMVHNYAHIMNICHSSEYSPNLSGNARVYPSSYCDHQK